MKRNIHLVYEHIYRNKELPIGIDIDNPIIDDLLVKHNWEWHGPLIADYREKLGYNVPVFLNNLPNNKLYFISKPSSTTIAIPFLI